MNGRDIDVLGDSGGIVVDALGPQWLTNSLGVLDVLLQHPGMTAVLGAVVGATIAGRISHKVQMVALREDRKQREDDRLLARQALASSMFIRMLDVHLVLNGVRDHVDGCFARSEIEDGEPWQVVQPFANPPDRVHFTTEEKGMLLSINPNVFLEVMQLEKSHNSVVDLAKMFRIEKRELTDRLTARQEEAQGLFAGDLNEAQLLALRPRMLQVNDIVGGMYSLAKKSTVPAYRTLEALQKVFREELELNLPLQVNPPAQPEDEPGDEPAAQQPAPPSTAAPAPAGGA